MSCGSNRAGAPGYLRSADVVLAGADTECPADWRRGRVGVWVASGGAERLLNPTESYNVPVLDRLSNDSS
jgi:hypothetical protein